MILALDLSTTGAGYASFDNNGKLQESGVIKPKNPITSTKVDAKLKRKLNMDARCHDVIVGILQILSKNKYDTIIIEDTYSGKDPYCYKWLCRLQGAVIGQCIDKIPIIYKTPTTWRKELGIKSTKIKDGKTVRLKNEELKAADIFYVVSKGYTPEDDNEADAICIGLSYFI